MYACERERESERKEEWQEREIIKRLLQRKSSIRYGYMNWAWRYCAIYPASYTLLRIEPDIKFAGYPTLAQTKYLMCSSRMCSYTVTLHIRKNTQKSKFLLSQAFKWKKIMFFVIHEMPSKTFVML